MGADFASASSETPARLGSNGILIYHIAFGEMKHLRSTRKRGDKTMFGRAGVADNDQKKRVIRGRGKDRVVIDACNDKV